MINNYSDWLKHVFKEFPSEACGIVADSTFHPAKNIHPAPTCNFKIDGQEWLNFTLNYKVQAVVHSHTQLPPVPVNPCAVPFDPRCPSHSDMVGIENTGLPWGIIYCDGSTVTDMLWIGMNPEPLMGRSYIPGVNDCYTLYQDYLKLNHNITTPIYPRSPAWNQDMPTLFDDHFLEDHVPININETRAGDLLLFQMGSKHINHCGVAVSDTRFLHHLYNGMSAQATIRRYAKFLKAVVRHKGLT